MFLRKTVFIVIFVDMKRLLLLLIVSSLLVHPTVKTIFLVQWKLNQQEITRVYCINKAKPEMQCNGQCYLAKKMRQIEADYAKSKLPFEPKHAKATEFTVFLQPFKQLSILPIVVEKQLFGGLYREPISYTFGNYLLKPPIVASVI